MTRILWLSLLPPTCLKNTPIKAEHYRCGQFLLPTLDAGHHVLLCSNELGEADFQQTDFAHRWRDIFSYRHIPFAKSVGWVKQLQAIHDHYQPDCIVAIGFTPAKFLTRLQTTVPIWIDIYGDYLTIVQAARYRLGTDRGVVSAIQAYTEVLKIGDIFSGCGTPQCHALVGELAMAGRLNARTFGYEFTQVILPGVPKSADSVLASKSNIRGTLFPSDAFTILWCGGYNTWTDIDTLFMGIETILAHNQHAHFVSIGASTYTAPDNNYDRFVKLIENSPHKERFHLLGWQPWQKVAAYYQACDVGINIDALHYETIYGTRTRIVEMMSAGLPIVTTFGTELATLLVDANVALGFYSGEWQQFADALQTFISDKQLHNQYSQNSLTYGQNELSFSATTQSFQAWISQPVSAPDKHQLPLKQRVEFQLRKYAGKGLWRVLGLTRG